MRALSNNRSLQVFNADHVQSTCWSWSHHSSKSVPCCNGNELGECAAQSGEPGGREVLNLRGSNVTGIEVAEVADIAHPEVVQYKGVDTRETDDFVECVVP